MKNILLLIFAVIVLSCSSSVKKLKEENQQLKAELELFKSLETNRQKAVEHAQTRFFKVEDEREILSILFDTEDFDPEGRAVWTPNFAERLNFPLSYDGFCYTQFERVLLYNDEFKRAVVVFATYAMNDNGEPSTTNADAPMVSLAYFTQRKENGWELTAFKKAFRNYGAWGEIGDVSLKQIGKHVFALDLSSSYSNRVESMSFTTLYSIPDFEPLFDITMAYKSNNEDGNKAFAYQTKLVIKPSSNQYYDITTVTTGTKLSDSEPYDVISAYAGRSFYFDENYGIYIEYKAIKEETEENIEP